MSESSVTPLIPAEGWHVLHLFYQIDHAQWSLYDADEKRAAKTRLSELVQEIRATEATQLVVLAIATPKADVGFILLTPDLQVANVFEKQLGLALGPGVLSPVYSYLSLTEGSEYTTTRQQYTEETLIAEKQLQPGTAEFEAGLKEFDARMEHYRKYRLYPKLPDWPVVCFYPMSKKREGGDNWFSLDFKSRRELMGTHAKTGRAYSGRILQMITGSTGLDEYEWGVTLLSKDSTAVKDIVYEMRFDEVSARYAIFGDFYIGMQLPLDVLFRRVCL